MVPGSQSQHKFCFFSKANTRVPDTACLLKDRVYSLFVHVSSSCEFCVYFVPSDSPSNHYCRVRSTASYASKATLVLKNGIISLPASAGAPDASVMLSALVQARCGQLRTGRSGTSAVVSQAG